MVIFGLVAEAEKPRDETGVPFGNGFPSGKHYNLNILAKKDHFTCPAPEIDPETGQQVFGNVIFIPREQGTDAITILMESGRKGPKGAQDTATLQVTDWCSESFPDDGQNKGDCAVLRLPKHDKGYAVYARITGKPPKDPGEEHKVTITPELFYVEDEAGNDLILLGLVDSQGIAKFSSDGMTVTRIDTSDGKRGKGVRKATDVTALFLWTGGVAYLQEDSSIYCIDETGEWVCTELGICAVDIDADGVYDRADLLTDVGILGPDGTTLVCPLTDADGVPYEQLVAQYRYYENEWIFNIADFVGYLWHLDSTGAYHIQVRFYPL
jgi:hypothetical protein